MSVRKAKLNFILAESIYGTIGLILRFISLPAEVVVLCRGALGSVCVLLYLLWRKQRPCGAAIRKNRRWLILSGVALGLNWVFLFEAYRATSLAVASLCYYMAPIFVLMLAPWLYHERLTGRKRACVLAAFAGIVLVSGFGAGGLSDVNWRGVALGLAAALGFMSVILCNRQLRDISAYDKTVVQLAISALTVLPYVLYTQRGGLPVPDLRSVLLTLLLAVVHTGAAYCLYFGSLSVIPVQTVAVWGYMEPVVSVLCSTLILREPLTVPGWIGAALILGGALCSELV